MIFILNWNWCSFKQLTFNFLFLCRLTNWFSKLPFPRRTRATASPPGTCTTSAASRPSNSTTLRPGNIWPKLYAKLPLLPSVSGKLCISWAWLCNFCWERFPSAICSWLRPTRLRSHPTSSWLKVNAANGSRKIIYSILDLERFTNKIQMSKMTWKVASVRTEGAWILSI